MTYQENIMYLLILLKYKKHDPALQQVQKNFQERLRRASK